MITLNCLSAMLPTFSLARIVAPHGHLIVEIVASFGSQVVITASDDDSTLLKQVGIQQCGS
jgi:hypothetical protein